MAQGRLRFRLINRDEVSASPGELPRLLLHPSYFAAYFVVLAAVIASHVWDASTPLSVVQEVAHVLLGMTWGFITLFGVLLYADARAARGADVVIYATPLYLCVMTTALLVETLSDRFLGGVATFDLPGLALHFAFHYLLCEIWGGFVVYFLAPSVLASLRAGQGQDADLVARTSAEPPRELALTELVPVEGALTDLPPPVVTCGGSGAVALHIGDQHVMAADILHLRAQAGQVEVVTVEGRHMMPGPFTSVVAQLPAQLGRQVSRSDWVATAAVRGVQQGGRHVVLQLRGGRTIPIAVSRLPGLQDWVDDLMAAMPLVDQD